MISGYGGAITASEFAMTDQVVIPDSSFYFNLIPQPFLGKIETAKVYILLLNPGLGNLDLFAEEQSPEFRNKLINSLSGNCPHLYFDPSLHWTGGFQWFARKFKTLIKEVKEDKSWSMQETLSFFAEHVATIELVPYHSAHFSLNQKVIDQLQSVKVVRDFVCNDLVKRAEAGDCTIIVSRKARDWGIKESKNIVVYSATEARGAHISAKTRGGEAILKQLKKFY